MIREVNSLILKQASKLTYRVSDVAPNTFAELLQAPSLVIWSGASDHTIFQDARVNWAFRALHDQLHIETGLDFSPEFEIELGRIQAARYTGFMSDLVYIETAGQAEYYMKHGKFVLDQVEFTLNELRLKGWKV